MQKISLYDYLFTCILLLNYTYIKYQGLSNWFCYAALLPNAPLGVPEGEGQFFDHEGFYWAMVVMVGPFGPPLSVLWINGTVDSPLKGFLTLGLVSRAPKGSQLGLVC